MHLNAQPPVFIPPQYLAEVEKLSKAALMDMVWDRCILNSCGGETDAEVQAASMEEFRRWRDIILHHRNAEIEEFRRQKRDLKASFKAMAQ